MNSMPANIEQCLLDFKTLPNEKLHSYAQSIKSNANLINDLFHLFSSDQLHYQEIDPVCSQLFLFFRSNLKELQCFSLQFIPILVLRYLMAFSLNSHKNVCCIETYLLAIYNLIVNKEHNTDAYNQIYIPSIDQPSIYHMPHKLYIDKLTETNIANSLNDKVVIVTHQQQTDHINANNRFLILEMLITEYNKNISEMSRPSLLSLCQLCNRLSSLLNPKIIFNSNLLIATLTGIFFIMFNGMYVNALEALKAAHERANFELAPNLMLVTNALINSVERLKMEEEEEAVLFVNAPVSTPALFHPTHSHPVTASSFKIHKLPDDIEILNGTSDGNDVNGNPIVSTDVFSSSVHSPSNGTQMEARKTNKSASKKSKSSFKSTQILENKNDNSSKNKDLFTNIELAITQNIPEKTNKVLFMPVKNPKVLRAYASMGNDAQSQLDALERKNSLNLITEF